MECSRTAVDNLPVEILARIFCHLSTSAKPHSGDLHASAPPWGPVLHVCSWWRQVALETKDLWRIIPMGRTEWAQMALRLSHPRTISISFPPTLCEAEKPSMLHDAAVIALAASSRIHSVHLAIRARSSSQDQRLLECLKTLDTTQLVDLCLEGASTALYLNHASLPSPPLQLQALRLRRCLLSSCVNLFSLRLTRLQLVSCGLLSNFTLPMLIDIIQTLQSLVVLEIAGTLISDELELLSAIQHDRPRVCLPHLRYFKLQCELALIHAYLANIDVPPACELRVISLMDSEPNVPIPIQDTVQHLGRILVARMVAAMNNPRMQLDICFTEPSHQRHPGDIEVAVRKQRKNDIIYENTTCFLEWERGDSEYAKLRDVLAFVPNDITITCLNILMNLELEEWETLLPLLLRVENIYFASPRYTENFPLAHRRMSQQELHHLRNIAIADVRPATEPGTNPWPIIHLMLEATSHCIDLAVNIEFGQSAPTAEEQAVLSQYGKIHDVYGELWFRREANTTSSVD